MAEAADKAAWNRTCAMMAQLYNTSMAREGRPIDPMDFYPWERPALPPAPPPTPEQEAALAEMFPGTRRG